MQKSHHILIVCGNFYRDIAHMLLTGAQDALLARSAAFEVIEVPGALEIPPVISMAEAGASNYDGYIALGCVIRGQTTHYDYVCENSARALMDMSVARQMAIGNGILTVENRDQAIERARPERGDKGGFAAAACLEMLEIKARLHA